MNKTRKLWLRDRMNGHGSRTLPRTHFYCVDLNVIYAWQQVPILVAIGISYATAVDIEQSSRLLLQSDFTFDGQTSIAFNLESYRLSSPLAFDELYY